MSSPLSKTEKEKQKMIQEKCQTILASMLRDEDNKYCVDCDAKGPRWASWNLGIFLCIRCAGIHRNLGVHISRVKSVNLDSWTPEQVVSLQQMGNSRARAVYEANLPDNFRRPQTDSTLESFIRAKYESKKYIAKEWVCPPPVKVSWDAEIEMELKRKKEAKRKTGGGSGSPSAVELPSNSSTVSARPTSSSASSAIKEISQPTPVAIEPPAPVVKVSSAAQDLLGLDSIMSPSSNDLFGGLLSSAPAVGNGNAPAVTTASELGGAVGGASVALNSDEDSFFNQIAPSTTEKRTLDKNSIMALYNQSAPASSMATQNITSSAASLQNMFVPTGYGGQAQSAFGMPGNSMMAGNFNPLMQQQQQGNMFSSPMFPSSNGHATVPMNQLSQQLSGLQFGPTPTSGLQQHPGMMMPTGSALAPGMMTMNNASPMMGVGMNSTGATAAPMNPYMFAGSQPQQQQTQLYTNLWQ